MRKLLITATAVLSLACLATSALALDAPLLSLKRVSLAAGVDELYSRPAQPVVLTLQQSVQPRVGLFLGYNTGHFGAFDAAATYRIGNRSTPASAIGTDLNKGSFEGYVGFRVYLFKGIKETK